jgi:hypothetical protein
MAYADWSFCYTHLTYNVFSFSGIWFILYLVSMTSTTYTHTPLRHPLYTQATPYRVVLTAGDVLYLPSYW